MKKRVIGTLWNDQPAKSNWQTDGLATVIRAAEEKFRRGEVIAEDGRKIGEFDFDRDPTPHSATKRDNFFRYLSPKDRVRLPPLPRDWRVTPWTKAQVKKASVVLDLDAPNLTKQYRVAVQTFGPRGRYAAELVRSRFGLPTVFIQDAEEADPDFPTLPLVVWQGSPDEMDTAIQRLFTKYRNSPEWDEDERKSNRPRKSNPARKVIVKPGDHQREVRVYFDGEKYPRAVIHDITLRDVDQVKVEEAVGLEDWSDWKTEDWRLREWWGEDFLRGIQDQLEKAKRLANANYETWGHWVIEGYTDENLKNELRRWPTMESWIESRKTIDAVRRENGA